MTWTEFFIGERNWIGDLFLLVGSGIFFAVWVSWLVKTFAPTAKGSGIPEVSFLGLDDLVRKIHDEAGAGRVLLYIIFRHLLGAPPENHPA